MGVFQAEDEDDWDERPSVLVGCSLQQTFKPGCTRASQVLRNPNIVRPGMLRAGSRHAQIL